MTINLYQFFGTPSWVQDIQTQLGLILANQGKIMSALDDLTAAIAQEDTVIASAITLINGFAAQLAAAGTDPTKLAALQADVTAKSTALAAAVAANTPAAPAPAPAPTSP
jgi:hypothetical protein